MRPNTPFVLAVSNANLKPGGRLVEEAEIERRKAFAAAHRSDEDRQIYIIAYGHVWSVTAKAKGKATCS